MKRFLEIWIGFCWIVIVAIVWGFPASAQIAGGANTTADSGKVHIIGNATSQAGGCTTASTTYSGSVGIAVPTEPQPCFALVYPTAQGIPNSCHTLFWPTAGGGTTPFLNGTNPLWSNGTQWNAVVAFTATPSTGNPNWTYGLVEGQGLGVNGTALGGCWNVIFPQYILNASGKLDADLNSTSSCAFTIDVNGVNTNWPQSASNYVLTFNDNGEQVLPSAQSGSFSASYTYSACTRGYNGTTTTTHLANTWVTLTDTSGVAASEPANLCSIAALADYVATAQDAGTLPGQKNDWYFGGWSFGSFLSVEFNQIGHKLISSGICPQNPTNNSWVIRKTVAASLPADLCVTTQVSVVDPISPSPYTQASPFPGFTYGVALTGYNTTNPANFSSIDLTAADYAITGLPTVTPNTACAQARKWSPQFSQTGNNSNPVGIDPKPSPIALVIGDVDEQIGAVQQANFITTTLIPAKSMFIVNGFHSANMTAGSGCSGGGACADGTTMEWLTQELYSPPTVASVSNTSVSASGVAF